MIVMPSAGCYQAIRSPGQPMANAAENDGLRSDKEGGGARRPQALKRDVFRSIRFGIPKSEVF